MKFVKKSENWSALRAHKKFIKSDLKLLSKSIEGKRNCLTKKLDLFGVYVDALVVGEKPGSRECFEQSPSLVYKLVKF
jgi:hypothetical protein